MAVCLHHPLACLPFPPKPKPSKRPPPISISNNPSHLDPAHLQALFLSANHTPLRFPDLAPDGRVAPVSLERLHLALSNSSVVVSAFSGDDLGMLGGLVGRVVGVSGSDARLVGFGRAVSDGGLTASIHDVVVTPALQRTGIGRKIVNRIIRLLTSRGIYDISALCSKKERTFFEACGFGKDSLGSTTMIYTRMATEYSEEHTTTKRVGRLLLLVPPPREVFQTEMTEHD